MNTCNDELLLESTSYFDVLEQMQDGIFITDTEYTIRYWNPAAEAILGYPSQDVCGWSCATLGPLCKRDAAGNHLCGEGICPLALALRGGFSGRYPHYVFMRAANGREVPLSLSVTILKNKSGQPVGAIGMFRDMTEEYGQLKLAGEIQRHMVTTEPFAVGSLRVSTLFHPLEVTGGDYVEAFKTDTGLLVASSADATGHGVSAALFAMIYKTLFHGSLKSTYSPAKMLEMINQDFIQTSMVEGYYLTASILVMDPKTRTGYFASAGHPMALIFRRRHGVLVPEPIRERSFMIGMVEGCKYQEIPFSLDPGDIMFLASDGVYEAEDTNGMPFEIEGVTAFFADWDTNERRNLEDLYTVLKSRNPLGQLADDISALMIEADSI
ncbi:MAG: SpoIIE family protein phosphatase [Termitinemataceae bacterium]